MTRAVFVDVAVTDSKRRKKHCCYDPVDDKFFKIKSLMELENYDEVYIDMLFPVIYEEIEEVIKRGKKTYLLKETKLIKKKRIENNLNKNDENDAYILSLIPKEFYKELKVKDVQVRSLMSDYILTDKEIVRLKNKMAIKYKDIQEHIQTFIKILEKRKEKIGQELHNLMEDNEFYKKVLEYFGYKKSPMIAMLLMTVDFSRGLHKIFDYLGLHAKAKKYNHFVRTILSKIAKNIYNKTKRQQNNILMKYVKIVQYYPKKKALLKIQVEMIRDIRRLWVELNNQKYTEVLATR